MSLPKYAEYKDSGLEWVAYVPEHWDIMPCRAFVNEKSQKNEGAANQNYLSLMANVGIIPYEEKGDVGNKKPEDLSKCKLVAKGDLVVNSMNYGIGSYGLSPLDGVCSPVYIVMTPRLERVESRFALRIFENKAFQTYAQSFGNGILDHRAAINWDILKVIGVGIPPRSEQVAILTFLDRETGKIDALIAEQEKLLTLLAEKRQATISHAVTRGLNPNAPMKDSSVPWLGEVPAHWEVLVLRRFINRFEQGWSPECESRPAEPGEWGVLKAGCVNGGEFDANENKALPASLVPRNELELQSGDVLMSRASGSSKLIGSVACVSDTPSSLMLSDKIFRIHLSADVDPKFFAIAMGSTPLRQQIERAIGGAEGLANNLPQASIKEFWMTLPSIEEQRTIIDFLGSAKSKLDALAHSVEHAIALLKERRSALIAAVVTGKIDVRGAA